MVIAVQTGSLPAPDQNFSLGMFYVNLQWRVQCCASFHKTHTVSFLLLAFRDRDVIYITDVRRLWQRLLIFCCFSYNNKLVNSPAGVPSNVDGHVYFWDVLLKI